jgi:hypothetical protein
MLSVSLCCVLFFFVLCTLCCQFLCVFVLFFFVLCTLCCQFLCVVFCFSLSCVPYVVSFSGLFIVTFILVEHCLSLFFWLLYCLSIELRFLITSLSSSNFSYRWRRVCQMTIFYLFSVVRSFHVLPSSWMEHKNINRICLFKIYSYSISSQIMLIRSRSVWVIATCSNTLSSQQI